MSFSLLVALIYCVITKVGACRRALEMVISGTFVYTCALSHTWIVKSEKKDSRFHKRASWSER